MGEGICGKPQIKCGECPHQALIPVSDEVIERHLRGGTGHRSGADDFIAGVCPMLPDETCWFLAVDFDGESWSADAVALMETSDAKGIPVVAWQLGVGTRTVPSDTLRSNAA